jgi:FlaA1/EpsC-like NDP-sugar epimerase
MTIPEAAGLVLQSAAQGHGGEIFTLDMGKPVKIVDLASQLIELSGFAPGQDIRIEFTGLRPGEKLFEELSYKGENITSTPHPKIMRLVCEPLPLDRVRQLLAELTSQMHRLDPEQLKRLLKQAVPEYQPQLNIQTVPSMFKAEPQKETASSNGHSEWEIGLLMGPANVGTIAAQPDAGLQAVAACNANTNPRL